MPRLHRREAGNILCDYAGVFIVAELESTAPIVGGLVPLWRHSKFYVSAHLESPPMTILILLCAAAWARTIARNLRYHER